jgi:hypothetical protein
VTSRPAKQRAADMLIRAACHRLPGEVREERGSGFTSAITASLTALLSDTTKIHSGQVLFLTRG